MTVEYGSFSYIISILIPIALLAVSTFALRKFSVKVARRVIFFIMLLNVLQHLLKTFIYSHLDANYMYDLGITGFTAYSTAYNMCAFLILISPVAFFVNFRPLRDFVYILGIFAGIIAIIIPYWSIGKPCSDPDFLRSLLCHGLLFLSSGLSLSLGHHSPNKRTFLFMGLYILIALGVILLNNLICIKLGLYGQLGKQPLADALRSTGSVWMFGPPEQFSWLVKAMKAVFPDALIVLKNGDCVPVLWYALPMYLAGLFGSFPICILIRWYQEKFTKSSVSKKTKLIKTTKWKFF